MWPTQCKHKPTKPSGDGNLAEAFLFSPPIGTCSNRSALPLWSSRCSACQLSDQWRPPGTDESLGLEKRSPQPPAEGRRPWGKREMLLGVLMQHGKCNEFICSIS